MRVSLVSPTWSFAQEGQRNALEYLPERDRPARALIKGRLAYQPTVTPVQSLIIVGLGLTAGADFPGGVTGVAVRSRPPCS
jgi:hypothetical protein